MQVYRQSPLGFLRCMGNIAWSAFRHPFKTTLCDWETGKVIGHYTQKEFQELLETRRVTNTLPTQESQENQK